MLTKFRIEVEEGGPNQVVAALTMYEHVIQQAEAARYGLLYADGVDVPGVIDTPPGESATMLDEHGHTAPSQAYGRDGAHDYYNGQLGKELIEEVIEYDDSIPAYKGRRVVRFENLAGRAVWNERGTGFVVERAIEKDEGLTARP